MASVSCLANELNIINKSTSSTSLSNANKDEEEAYVYADQITRSVALPMVINAIIDMGVLQLIHDQAGSFGLSAAEIASQIQTRNPDAPGMLDRMLRLLATHSIVSCTAVTTMDGCIERRYGPTLVTRCFVPNEDGISLAPILNLIVDNVYLGLWSKLKEVVMEGGVPFNKVYGMHAFEYNRLNPSFNELFNKAMYDSSTYIIKKIILNYEGFNNIQQLVDVGGGVGHNIRAITSKYPCIKGINFDLPHVIEQAPQYPGVEHVSGDMFESVPEGDAIFMKWILHDWSDDHCIMLLKNCYNALPDSGRVIVVEHIVTDKPETTICARSTSQFDLIIMTLCKGGKERTRREFESLAKVAGFAAVKFDCCVSCFWVIELYK